MKCPIEARESAEVLLAYCARSLDDTANATLERHLGICPSCREWVEAQRTVWQALDEWDALPVSADFDRKLYTRIEREVSWWDRLLRPFRPLLISKALPIAAAACLATVAGILIDRPHQLPGQGQVEAVQVDQVENQLEDMELLREFGKTVRADAAQTKL